MKIKHYEKREEAFGKNRAYYENSDEWKKYLNNSKE